MHDDLKIRLRRLLRAACGFSIALCGLCLMAACVSIYRSDDVPFSRQTVAEAFSSIRAVIYLCLGLTVLSCVYCIAVPGDQTRALPGKSARAALRQLRGCVCTEECDTVTAGQLTRLARMTRLLRLVQVGVCTVACTVFGLYALDGRHFSQENINRSMIDAMAWLLPCLTAALTVGLLTGLALEQCAREQLALLRKLPRRTTQQDCVRRTGSAAGLRLVLLALGAGLVIFGAATGGIADVLAKAINICTECIGLG